MNAEIFFHPEGEPAPQTIASLLAKYIHPSINVKILQAGDRHKIWPEGYEQAGRYVKLLLAAVPPGREFAMGVKDIPYGFYMYSNYFGQSRSFQGSDARVLFPAVAVNGRMVLVPENLVSRLTSAEGMALFRPLEAGGLAEVDFAQPELLGKAIQKVGDLLRADAVEMVRRYVTYSSHANQDLKQVAANLGFDDVPFLEDAMKQQAHRHTFYGQLTCQFSRTAFPMKRWTRVTITIKNSSDVGLSSLFVDFRGPIRIRPERVATDVLANGSAEIDVAIKPEDEGEFPLEVAFTLAEDRALRDWLPTTYVWLTTLGDVRGDIATKTPLV
jgi:hypothetical protein